MGFNSGRDPVELGVFVCIHETHAALLCRPEGNEDESDDIWVPKSVLHVDSDVNEKDDEGELVVYQWWAEDKGLV